MSLNARRSRNNLDIWPGFVDALATLLMVIIFLLMIFIVAQFHLNDALLGRDKALDSLNKQVAELAELLDLERKSNTDLRRRPRRTVIRTAEQPVAARRDAIADDLPRRRTGGCPQVGRG